MRPSAVLIPEGIYTARLAEVQEFVNSFGPRIGLVYEITEGEHAGVRLMESAAPSMSSDSKLASLVAGIAEPGAMSEAELHEAIGTRCRIMVRQAETRTGRRYAAIVRTLA